MKKIILPALLLLCNCLASKAQQITYEPQLLILSPNNVSFDPSLKKEVDEKSEEIKTWSAKVQQQETSTGNQPDHIKLMQQNVKEFLKHADFATQIPVFAQSYLAYRFYEKFPNCVILLKDEKSTGSTEGLQKIADAQKSPYVLNFSKVSFYKQNGQTYCKIDMQLYEQRSNQLLIDKEYTGGWNNPGFEFTCQQGTIDCTINNSLSHALPDVISQIALNNPTIKRERLLAQERYAFITSTIYPRNFDAALIRQVTTGSSFNMDIGNLYQAFYNQDKTKFVGFFIKTIDKKDTKPMLTDKEDQNVKVITSKDIHDAGYLDQSPRTYSYIVRGIKYGDKWYTDKSEVTYFDASGLEDGKLQYLNNLQQWGFFAENSVEPSQQFWEGKLFEKIVDKRKDPKWEKYNDIWAEEERENRDYIGQYELVANELKKENQLIEDVFRKKIVTEFFLPFYNDQVKLKSNHFDELAQKPEDMVLIYPKDKHVIISPVTTKNEKGVLINRYFLFLPASNEVFEWDWTKPSVIKKGKDKSTQVYDTMNAFTTWNYSYITLDDAVFWNEKVLAKEGNNYKFLTKLK